MHFTPTHIAAILRRLTLLTLTTATLSALSQAPTPDPQKPDAITGGVTTPFTLRVTSREVVIDVAARDREDRPVRDLIATDFRIFELVKGAPKLAKRISAFHIVDPALVTSHTDTSGGFRLVIGGGCAIGGAFHYQLAYQPSGDGWASGYHQILVTVTRKHLTLSFRHQYYVGKTATPDAPPKPAKPPTRDDAESLHRAACYHPDNPPSIALSAHIIQTADTDPLRYSLVVRPDSLAFTSISDDVHRVQLDYAACTFNAAGKVVNYLHSAAARVLTAADYDRILSSGFPNLIDLPRQGDPVLVRLVVRDPETGNLGSIDVSTANPDAVELNLPDNRDRETITPGIEYARDNAIAGSFGSIEPQPGALCGDVFELPSGIKKLPDGFTDLDSAGTLYTYALNQTYRLLREGLPGITARPEWFAIDYRGEFWITHPGKYTFRMGADDGALLYIDNKRLIDEDGIHQPHAVEAEMKLSAGRHTIHLPYFQGPLHVALKLEIQPPDGDMKIFDIRDYTKPEASK